MSASSIWLRSRMATALCKRLFLAAPDEELGDLQKQAFDHVFERAVAGGQGSTVRYDRDHPKHQFLRYLVEHRSVLLHGSNRPDIEVLEPALQTDYSGQQMCAVFASGDGIWPLFFAVVDHAKYRGSLRNGCWVITDHRGTSQRFYFFSLNRAMLKLGPWTDGTVYILPRQGFTQESRGVVRFDEWASETAVRPVAKLPVTPEDLPFLPQVTGHEEKESMVVSWLLFKRRQKKAGRVGAATGT
jgi:hypothetical protein